MRLHNVWTAPYECSGKICVKSKGAAIEPSVFQQDVRCHQVPWELRLISWQRILMWHLAVEKYHLSNGRGAVLWPGIIHSATGWQTGLAASPVFRGTLCFTDKNLTLHSIPHYVTHLSVCEFRENKYFLSLQVMIFFERRPEILFTLLHNFYKAVFQCTFI